MDGLLMDLVKVVLDVDVGIQQMVFDGRNIQLTNDEVLHRLLEICISDQNGSFDSTILQDQLDTLLPSFHSEQQLVVSQVLAFEETQEHDFVSEERRDVREDVEVEVDPVIVWRET